MTPQPAQQHGCKYSAVVSPGLKPLCTHPERKLVYCGHAIEKGKCPEGREPLMTAQQEDVVKSIEPIFAAPFDGDVYIKNGDKSEYLFTIEKGQWELCCPHTSAPAFTPVRHPTMHFLKTWTPYFKAMKEGKKKFEKRVWDRDYQVDDNLVLQEWNPDTGYTGDSISLIVTWMLTGEFAEPGICLMSVDGIEFETREQRDTAIRNATLDDAIAQIQIKIDKAFKNSCRHDKESGHENPFFLQAYCFQMNGLAEAKNTLESLRTNQEQPR